MTDVPIPLKIAPGMVVTDSIFAVPGRYVDGDKVRFYRSKPQKIGGWEKYATTAYVGMARSIVSWADFAQNNFVQVGTHCKVFVYDSTGSQTDITPFDDTGTLGNDPFTTVISTTTVTVADTSHAREIGSTVHFSGAAAVGGITIDGEYLVTAVPDANSYEIEHSSAATSSATGGGASVAYSYELNCGLISASIGGGWGIGGWGEETWGTARTNTTFVQYPRIWIMDIYGEDIYTVASGRGGGDIYIFDATNQTTRMLALTNAPSSNAAVFVTDDRHVIALGAGGSPMKVQWPDQDDATDWTPSATNTAGSRNLQVGSRLINGSVLQNRVNLIWSDSAVYLWQYTGSNFVFDSRLAGTDCGLIGPMAYCVVSGVAYWMSRGNFHMYSGYVQDIPNADDIREFVNTNISELQESKTFCGYNSMFKEIWWWFVTAAGNDEPSAYVVYDLKTQTWVKGTMARTAFANQENRAKEPLMTGAVEDDYVYTHETGVNDEDGAAISAYLTMAPFNIANGGQVVDVWHVEPDFETQVGDLTLQMLTYERRREASLLDDVSYTISTTDDLEDIHVAGRFISFKLTSNSVDGDFRVGEPVLTISPAGGRL